MVGIFSKCYLSGRIFHFSERYLSGLDHPLLHSFKRQILCMLEFEISAVAEPSNDRIAVKFGGLGRDAG